MIVCDRVHSLCLYEQLCKRVFVENRLEHSSGDRQRSGDAAQLQQTPQKTVWKAPTLVALFKRETG